MSGIYIASYPVLAMYAILAASGITTVNPTTVANGFYGSSPTPTYTGTFTPSGSPSGVDTTDAATAQTSLTALVGAVNAYTSGLPSTVLSTTYGAVTLTFFPGINYHSTSAITFTGTTIVLDAQGDPNAQFFISAVSAITFTNVPTITLINNAANCNTYWLAGTAISFSGTMPATIPGIFLAGTAITFANASIILGRLYAQTANVTFSGVSSVNATCTGNSGVLPIAGVCFPADTPIETDQGRVLIQDVNPDVHTIRGEKIAAVTRTVTQDTYLVCFDKDSLATNYPHSRTVMSKRHKVFYGGAMVEARDLIGDSGQGTGVHKIPYEGEVLYNVLLDTHSGMIVNGLVCETLDPDNIIAKLHTSRFSDKYKTRIVAFTNKCILNGDFPSYLRLIDHMHRKRARMHASV